MKVGRAVVCALSLGSRLVSSKSELEMALEYSEYLAESDDEDGRALQALWLARCALAADMSDASAAFPGVSPLYSIFHSRRVASAMESLLASRF